MGSNTNSIPSPLRIILVEDSEHDILAFNRALERGGLTAEVTHFVRAEECLQSLEQCPPPFDLLVADYKLPGMTGLELCKQVIAMEISLPCLIVTGAGTENIAVEALQAGVTDYLVKDSQQNYLNILPLLLPEIVSKHQNNLSTQVFRKERETVAAISELFLTPEDSETLCQKLPKALAAGFDFPVSVILLLHENRTEMTVKGLFGVEDTTLINTQLPLEATNCGKTITQGIPLLTLDVSSSPNLHCFLKDSKVDTCLSVPIKGKRSGVMGALVLADPKRRPDADIHISALQVISQHLGQEIERKQNEEELRLQAEIMTNIAEGVLLIQADTLDIVYANPAIETMFGYKAEEVLGKHVSFFNAPTENSPEETAKMIVESLSDHGFWQGEVKNIQKDGTLFWSSATISGFEHHRYGNVWVSIQSDITEKKKAEDALRKSQQEWSATFDAMADIVTIQNKDMRIVRANKAAHTFFHVQYGELNGQHCYEAFTGTPTPCPGCPLFETLEDIGQHSAIMQHKNLGKTFQVSSSAILDDKGKIQYLVHIARDITEQKRLEEDLFQAHKMEAIGTLAGGIAHDFNNILSAIVGFTELAKTEIKDNTSAVDDLTEVLQASHRAAGLVKQILTISRKGTHERKELQPYFIVKEALKLMRASLPTTIEIQADINPQSGTILADPTKIHQVVINLCTNALHAMKEETGVLKITLRRRELSNDEIPPHLSLTPGPFIELTVSDTGCGMDKKTEQRIFEPYFTTKATGKGTGLGLALVRGIVEDYEGMITVDSEPGKGTTFHIFFPTIPEKEKAALPAEKDKSLFTGTERILVVDDEKIILTLQKTILSRLGYNVTAKISSEEALAAIKKDPSSFDLLITDQTMPRLSGAKLTQEVLSIRPDMPIILCTGYSATLSEKEAEKIGIKRYLYKPVDRENLARTVRNVLDENPSL